MRYYDTTLLDIEEFSKCGKEDLIKLWLVRAVFLSAFICAVVWIFKLT